MAAKTRLLNCTIMLIYVHQRKNDTADLIFFSRKKENGGAEKLNDGYHLPPSLMQISVNVFSTLENSISRKTILLYNDLPCLSTLFCFVLFCFVLFCLKKHHRNRQHKVAQHLHKRLIVGRGDNSQLFIYPLLKYEG